MSWAMLVREEHAVDQFCSPAQPRPRSQAHSMVPPQLPGQAGRCGAGPALPEVSPSFSPIPRALEKWPGPGAATTSALRWAGGVLLDKFGSGTQFPQLQNGSPDRAMEGMNEMVLGK